MSTGRSAWWRPAWIFLPVDARTADVRGRHRKKKWDSFFFFEQIAKKRSFEFHAWAILWGAKCVVAWVCFVEGGGGGEEGRRGAEEGVKNVGPAVEAGTLWEPAAVRAGLVEARFCLFVGGGPLLGPLRGRHGPPRCVGVSRESTVCHRNEHEDRVDECEAKVACRVDNVARSVAQNSWGAISQWQLRAGI